MNNEFTFEDYLDEIAQLGGGEPSAEEMEMYKDLFYFTLPIEYEKAVALGYDYSFEDFVIADIYAEE